MNARAGEMDHPSPRSACEVTTLSNRLHPVAGPKRQRRKLGGPLQPRAVLGVEKLQEPMKLLVRELLRHLCDLAQQLIVGHCGNSLPGISTPELDGGLRRCTAPSEVEPGDGPTRQAQLCTSFLRRIPRPGYGGRETPKRWQAKRARRSG